jgi:hypothetical protein
MNARTPAPLLLALLLALPAAGLPVAAVAQSASVTAGSGAVGDTRVGGGELTVRARVLEVDTANRTATLRGPSGNVVTVAVPPDVKNFENVRAGDMLTVRYLMAIAARIEPASRSGIRERVESAASTVAPAGSTPGTAGVRTVEVVATVTALDRKARTATLRGVHRTVKVSVPKDVDLSKVKVGSEVRAVITEAAVLSVEHPAGAAGKGG